MDPGMPSRSAHGADAGRRRNQLPVRGDARPEPIAGNRRAALPTATNLERCLANVVEGFTRIRRQCPRTSGGDQLRFSRPGGLSGRDHRRPGQSAGISRRRRAGADVGGEIRIPVFINNNGDLFAYGEAIAGLLPHVNRLLAAAGSRSGTGISSASPSAPGSAAALCATASCSSATIPSAGEIWLFAKQIAGPR